MTALSFRLAERGCTVVDKVEEAEVVVVNTCCVTAGTEAKTRRFLRRLSLLAPQALICVTGCLAQQKAEQLGRIPNVRWVVGNGFKNDIADIIHREETGIFCGPLRRRQSLPDIPDSPIFFKVSRRTRIPIKIQEGCDFRCSYCIVPLVRGPSRSIALKEINEACRKAIEAGFKEIVLTGTHIGQYHDRQAVNFTELVETITNNPGDYRVRLSSLDPGDLSETLIRLVTMHPRVCRHLHVCVQSLSQQVIERMNRSASTITSTVSQLAAIRSMHPQLGIGGDFIVGFPGETDSMFEETVHNVETIGFSYGHVFRYSRRPSTAAAELPGQIDEKEKTRRSARLRQVLQRSRTAFVDSCKGKAHRIIVETEGPAIGLSSNYLRIEVPGAAYKRNDWCWTVITDFNDQTGRCFGSVSV